MKKLQRKVTVGNVNCSVVSWFNFKNQKSSWEREQIYEMLPAQNNYFYHYGKKTTYVSMSEVNDKPLIVFHFCGTY